MLMSRTTRCGSPPRSACATTICTSSFDSQNRPFSSVTGLAGAPSTRAAGTTRAPIVRSIYPSPEGNLPAVPYSIPAAEQWSAKRAYSAATKGLFTCNQPARERGGNQPLLRIVLAAELELVDAAGALLDLFGRDQDLAHVLVGLAKMVLQFDHAVTQPPEVVHHAADLGADLIGRLAH